MWPSYHRLVLHVALAVGAALVSIAFGLSTLDRWLTGRRPHELAWTLAFAQFALAAAAMAAGSQSGWTPVLFRCFYLFGGILSVAFLGLGEVMLLAGKTVRCRAGYGVALFAAFSVGVMVAAPFTAPLPADRLAQGSDVFATWPRLLAALGSGGGATVVVAGSLWSAARRPTPPNLAGNLLIAGGTLVSGAGGLLNSVFDEMTAFAVTQSAGLTLLFIGFLIVTGSRERRAPGLLDHAE